MNYEYELDFFCDVLKKCHIRTTMLSMHDTTDLMVDPCISNIIGSSSDKSITIQKAMGPIESQTEYKFKNELGLQYIFMRLPILSEKNLLFIGPYLSSQFTSKEIMEIGEGLGLNTNTQKILKDYYMSLPVISENDRFFTMVHTFCEHMWQTSSFSVVELSGKDTLPFLPLDPISRGDNLDELLINMDAMEMRYDFENELILAVKLGQEHKEKALVSAFSDQMFEKRLQDPVRNSKNYCIIMNTLLRKAAEQGGVHPIYIDRMSSKFAAKIEQITDVRTISEFMREMFLSYCRLVRKYSTEQYSPIVKKTTLIINSDISAELSLRTLAQKLNISSGYLATVFKKETGKTVSEYTREKRINHALHLLNTTNLQIQTIAMHCGIMDVQYFSKIFKKQIGQTPKEYRESMRR